MNKDRLKELFQGRNLGRFKTPIEAYNKYKEEAIKRYGEFVHDSVVC